MGLKETAEKIVQLIGDYPQLAAPLLGAGTGALTGAAFSEQGAIGTGALRGGLLGGLIGGGAGLGAYGAQKAFPTAGGMTAAGAGLGGAVGGLLGQSKASPWAIELMKMQHEEKRRKREEKEKGEEPMEKKEPEVEPQVKEAQVKEAAERLTAFEFGMDVWCQKNGIEKAEFAKAAGVNPDEFTVAAKLWFEDVKAAQAPAK